MTVLSDRATNLDAVQLAARTLRERVRITESGCWEWLGFVNRQGYGKGHFPATGEQLAYRHAYRLFRGEIPAGLTLDHLCRNRTCVNPDHLEAVTLAENVMRGNGVCALNARKTHCKRGHEFDPQNTLMRPGGRRECRKCKDTYRQRKRVEA